MRRPDKPQMDLGLDPPIDGGGGGPEMRGVSIRWLSGVVLTLFAGAGLISAAGATRTIRPRKKVATRSDRPRIS